MITIMETKRPEITVRARCPRCGTVSSAQLRPDTRIALLECTGDVGTPCENLILVEVELRFATRRVGEDNTNIAKPRSGEE